MTWPYYRGVTVARIFGALQIFPTTRNLVPRFKGSGGVKVSVSCSNESSDAGCPPCGCLHLSASVHLAELVGLSRGFSVQKGE